MILIAAVAATWLFVLVNSMASMRSATLDEDAEYERDFTPLRRARTAATAVAVAIPIIAAAASDASA